MHGFCGVQCDHCPDFTSEKCKGCKAGNTVDEGCFFVRCNVKHGTAYCNQCEVFPCVDITEFSEESASHKAAFTWLCHAGE